MRRNRTRAAARARALAGVALVAGLGAGACLDLSTEPLPDFDPLETADRLERVLGPVFASGNPIAAVEAAALAILDHAGTGTAAMLSLRPRPSLGTERTGHRGIMTPRERAAAVRAVPDGGLAVELPAALIGETLVWDVAEDRYVVDPDATGAPSDGIRFVYYEMGAVWQPAEPLVELGVLDITDLDAGTEERLGVVVVDRSGVAEDTVLAHVITMTGSFSTSQGTLDYAASGELSEGGTTVAFDLFETFTWSEAQNRETLAARYIYEADAIVDFAMEAASEFEAPEWEALAIGAQVAEGASEVGLLAALPATGVIDGRIIVDSRVVIWIGGTDGAPAFAHAGGEGLTEVELEALEDIWFAFSELVFWSDALIARPGEVLLLPG